MLIVFESNVYTYSVLVKLTTTSGTLSGVGMRKSPLYSGNGKVIYLLKVKG